jgi:hypothetical protein
MTNEPVMLPFEPGVQPFVRGWGLAGILVIPMSAWAAMGAVAASGVEGSSHGGSLVIGASLAVLAVVVFLGLRALQRWERGRRIERYARDRLPSLQRTAALDAYGRGGFADIEEAWRSVEVDAMDFYEQEMAVVREVYRDYHRLCWLPVQYAAVVPAAMGAYSLVYAAAGAVGLAP